MIDSSEIKPGRNKDMRKKYLYWVAGASLLALTGFVGLNGVMAQEVGGEPVVLSLDQVPANALKNPDRFRAALRKPDGPELLVAALTQVCTAANVYAIESAFCLAPSDSEKALTLMGVKSTLSKAGFVTTDKVVKDVAAELDKVLATIKPKVIEPEQKLK